MRRENPDIDLLCRQIEKSLNWGPGSGWIEHDFDDLSEKIQEKTQVRLSVSTLKRIWGRVRYESSPNIATLNALAKFLDFNNWRQFLQKNSLGPAVSQEAGSARPFPEPGRFLLLLLIALVLLLVSMGLISLLGNTNGAKPFQRDFPVQFQSRKVSDGLPNSVVFDYDASGYHSDSVYIQQNWDPTRREKVSGDGRQHTSIYYYPGFFRAKLIVDGQVKKESDVFIKSKGWLGIIGKKPVPIYLSPAEINLQGALGVSSKTLSQKMGSDVFNDRWVYFTNVREFEGLDPANFNFFISLRNSSVMEESACRKVKVDILGTESAIIIPLTAKGCISDMDLLTADSLIKGKENDLSAFGCDFSSFQQLSCSVENQRLKIVLNSKLIWDEDQKQTIGNIIGLRIGFEGSGEIKEVRFSGAGKEVYAERFGN